MGRVPREDETVLVYSRLMRDYVKGRVLWHEIQDDTVVTKTKRIGIVRGPWRWDDDPRTGGPVQGGGS